MLLCISCNFLYYIIISNCRYGSKDKKSNAAKGQTFAICFWNKIPILHTYSYTYINKNKKRAKIYVKELEAENNQCFFFL